MTDRPPAHRRLHAVARGRVQGVGFRQFVQRHATILGCRGYVRNMPDGRTVEVVAEGEESALEALLRHLQQGPPAARVRDVAVEWQQATGELPPFSVRD